MDSHLNGNTLAEKSLLPSDMSLSFFFLYKIINFKGIFHTQIFTYFVGISLFYYELRPLNL